MGNQCTNCCGDRLDLEDPLKNNYSVHQTQKLSAIRKVQISKGKEDLETSDQMMEPRKNLENWEEEVDEAEYLFPDCLPQMSSCHESKGLDNGQSLVYQSMLQESQLERSKPQVQMNKIASKARSKLKNLEAIDPFNLTSPFSYLLYEVTSKQITFLDENSGSTYRGSGKKGIPHGWGRLIDRDGTVVDSFFRNGKPHGYGRLISFQGIVYVGEFHLNKPHGRGTLKKVNGEEVTCSDWHHGKQNGETLIIQTQADGSNLTLFKGLYSEGKQEGPGSQYLPSKKALLEGSFKEGLLEGKGKIKYDRGRILEGIFHGGVCNDPHAKIVFVDGRKWNGGVRKGIPHGKGVLTTDEGELKKGMVCEHGRIVSHS